MLEAREEKINLARASQRCGYAVQTRKARKREATEKFSVWEKPLILLIGGEEVVPNKT